MFADIHFVTNNMGNIASSMNMQNIVNQLGKDDFACGRFSLWVGSK